MLSPSSPSRKTKRAKYKIPVSQSSPVGILGEPSPGLFPSREEFLKLLLVIFIASSVAVGFNFLSSILNSRPRPFCDSGDASQEIDICEVCPENGWCTNGRLACLNGYKKQGRICVEDGQLYRTAKSISGVVEDHVCVSHAQILCGGTGRLWFQEGDIMKIVDEHKAKETKGIWMEDDTFTVSLHKALETLEGYLETKAYSNGSKEYKCPEQLAQLHKPLDCLICQWIYRHVFLVLCIMISALCLTWMSWSLRKKLLTSARAEKLYQEVCEILEDNAMMARTKKEGEPWVVASWLRDHLLLPKERKDMTLWKKVTALIQEDSRIDQYPKLIKGESKILLEWQADGSLSSKRKVRKPDNRISRQEEASSAYLQHRPNACKSLLPQQ
ncbi:hypothetical protein AXF42_Ash009997 [Apostasia shenzhenica]|uniref:Man1/Src1-like C-terminal domain-containing protein n=1 Tax=Apostasia shenzhenica TaxID=1088818 RepID=A0A2I0ACI9_9ASPA|nr:hypothetical protein AXF42_Ash009997 [Apostasia shenzhenica]